MTESRTRRSPASCRVALLLVGTAAVGLPVTPVAAQRASVISGSVLDRDGEPAAGAFVTLREMRIGVAHTAYTNAAGRYALAGVPPGVYQVSAKQARGGRELREQVEYDGRGATWDFRLDGQPDRYGSGASFLNVIPSSAEKRQFMLDCTGCHVFNERIAFPGDHARSIRAWDEAMTRMVRKFGPSARFPIISEHRNPDRHAVWIASSMVGYPPSAPAPAYPASNLTGVVLTEYDLPNELDIPHDLMVDDRGRVVITGTSTGLMYVLFPASGAFQQVSIPVRKANPRALDIDAAGRWWVALGEPEMLAGYDPAQRSWTTHPVGAYPHSLHVDTAGRAWMNGHYDVDPEVIAAIDTETGRVTRFEVPPPAEADGPANRVPYGLRVDHEGRVWGTELRGNRLIRVDPTSARVDTWSMPEPFSGPRRLDIGVDGAIWIPEYAGGRLTRFDPEAGTFTSFDLPVKDALPYVVRVDQRRGTVWIGTGAADAILAFQPVLNQFTVFPLPTRGAMIRHLDVVEETGEVWASYSASPGVPAKIVRIRRP